MGRNLVHTVREWCPEKKVYPAVFPEEEFSNLLDPLTDGPKLVEEIGSDGLLIDTYRKDIGKGLVDYYSVKEITDFVASLHAIGKEAWIAGSISKDQLPELWKTGADVICVRGAACESLQGKGRFGEVSSTKVAELITTVTSRRK